MKRIFLFTVLYLAVITFCNAQDITYLEPFGAQVEYINPATAWSATSISISSGKTYTILVEGIASARGGSYKQHRMYTGPEGWPPVAGTPLPDFPSASVIGKIGSNGTPFYVGRIFSFKANISGPLFLGYNDYSFGDNTGFFVAYVFSKDNFPTSIIQGDPDTNIGTDYKLEQNYPNPFNPETKINFSVPESLPVKILIYNISGELVKVLLNENKVKGEYEVTWDGKNNNGSKLASGTYFYQAICGNNIQTKKMLLLK
ncbi:MAG: FlgD immunoglobulin-like domain containing protein [Melioribacteraceae bacterium]